MRQRSDAFDDGGTEWLGRQRVAHVADHDIGAAGLHAGLPAGSKPREIPTNATTAAMPMEMPTIVSPVRTGRRISPRATTVKKVMSVPG